MPSSAEHDRHPVERQEHAHLADERLERLVELERRAERPRAAVRGLEHVRPPAELVAQPLGLGRPRLGDRRLAYQEQDEPADDQAQQQLDPDLERDEVGVEVDRRVAVRAQPLEEREHRHARGHDRQRAADAVAESALDERQEHDLPHGCPALVAEDEDVRGDDREVERQRRQADPRLRALAPLAPDDPEEDEAADREREGHEPRLQEPAGRVVAAQLDLDDRERDRAEADPRDPLLQLPAALRVHARSPIRSSAHSACSRRSGSSPSA